MSVLGALLILSAFALLQRGVWGATGMPYLLFNLTGATALMVVAIWDRRVGFIILEAAWALVSVWSLAARRSRPSVQSLAPTTPRPPKQ
jgi:hypothetical protein